MYTCCEKNVEPSEKADGDVEQVRDAKLCQWIVESLGGRLTGKLKCRYVSEV